MQITRQGKRGPWGFALKRQQPTGIKITLFFQGRAFLELDQPPGAMKTMKKLGKAQILVNCLNAGYFACQKAKVPPCQ